MSHWNYNNNIFNPTSQEIEDSGWYGFVYIIDFPELNRKYIGRKYFWSKRTLPPLKGKKRKRHVKKESNWRNYTSSSDVVKQILENKVTDQVLYNIISIHDNKAETNYHEIKLQFMLNVLEEQDENGDHIYLNNNINTKFYKSEKFNEHRKLITEHYSKL